MNPILRISKSLPLILWLLFGGMSQTSHGKKIDQDFIDAHKLQITELFKQINLDYKGLEEVKIAIEKEKLLKASVELLDYYHSKALHTQYPLQTQYLHSIPEQAQDAVEDFFTLQNIRAKQKRLENGNIDWDYKGPKNDKEWAWLFNRHKHLQILLKAWIDEPKDIYLETIYSHIEDWASSNPAPKRISFSAAWRALEVARRILNSWTYIFYELPKHQEKLDRSFLLLLSSLTDHAEILEKHSSFWGGNHLITEKTALALIGIAWPEFKNSEAWIRSAVQSVEQELLKQSYPDGSYKELSTHYQNIVLSNIQYLLDLINLTNYKNENLKSLKQRCEIMWSYLYYTSRPNGFGALNNAGDYTPNIEYAKIGLKYFQREDWKFIESKAKAGKLTTQSYSQYYPYAGQAIMRSGWEKDAQWAFFDMGPHGTAHQHQDLLHLSISLGEQDILTDSGRYTYQKGKWYDFFRGPYAHNTLLINGKASQTMPFEVHKPLPTTHIMEADYDFFSQTEYFVNSQFGKGKIPHNRSIFYKKNQYWIVFDHIILFEENELEFNWNFHPSQNVQIQKNKSVSSSNSEKTLSIEPYSTQTWDIQKYHGTEDGQIRGWYSSTYNKKEARDSLSYKSKINSPQLIAWLIQDEKNKNLVKTLQLQRLQNQTYHLQIHYEDGSIEEKIIQYKKGLAEIKDYE